jgi:hypothetical protein
MTDRESVPGGFDSSLRARFHRDGSFPACSRRSLDYPVELAINQAAI